MSSGDGATRAQLQPPGPWQHQQVSAGGASFHVAVAGPEEPQRAVILLHDFPLFWWAWRAQLPALAAAGLRAIALDQRGFGASDLQPDGPDLARLAVDVVSVAGALGLASYSVVGSGLGGAVAWMVGALDPPGLRRVAAVCAPHPLGRRSLRPPNPFGPAGALNARLEVPWRRAHILRTGKLVDGILANWAAPAHRAGLVRAAAPYRAAMARPFAAAAALESYQASRRLSLESRRLLERPVAVPVLSVQARLDACVPARLYSLDARHTRQPLRQYLVEDSGHFPSEEAAQELSGVLVDFLAGD